MKASGRVVPRGTPANRAIVGAARLVDELVDLGSDRLDRDVWRLGNERVPVDPSARAPSAAIDPPVGANVRTAEYDQLCLAVPYKALFAGPERRHAPAKNGLRMEVFPQFSPASG